MRANARHKAITARVPQQTSPANPIGDAVESVESVESVDLVNAVDARHARPWKHALADMQVTHPFGRPGADSEGVEEGVATRGLGRSKRAPPGPSGRVADRAASHRRGRASRPSHDPPGASKSGAGGFIYHNMRIV
jgi:hypothetical protein